MLKTIRIGNDGRIVGPDRQVRTTRRRELGGPDQVQWIRVGADSRPYTIFFRTDSPFRQGSAPQRIPVPPDSPSMAYTVDEAQPVKTYKYDVLDANDGVLDDPDLIIDS